MRLASLACVLVLLAACGKDGAGSNCLFCAPTDLAPVSCTEQVAHFYLSGFSGPEFHDDVVDLPLGHSRRLLLSVASLTLKGCEAFVRSVAWSSERPEVAVLEGTSNTGAWVTAVGAGDSRVGAEVTFTSGRTERVLIQESFTPGTPRAEAVRVAVPAEAPRVTLLAGEVELAAPSPGSSTNAYRQLDVPSAGRVEMRVDWHSVDDRVFTGFCSGTVTSGGCAPHVIDTSSLTGRKPIVASAVLDAGRYTLLVQSLGPGAEVVSYEVALLR